MNGTFKFVLAKFFELTDEPIGWADSEIVIKRNDEYGGIFLTYIPELTFIGDGFGYLYQEIINLGYCYSCPIEITYECNGSVQKVFNGFINAANVDIDIEACKIKANLEPDDIYAAFLKSSNNNYQVQDLPITFPNGETLTPSYETIRYHNIETGTINADGFTDVLAFQAVKGLDYLARASTQNQLGVVSDFFTTQKPLTEQWEIVFTGAALKSGDTIGVTYKNYFGIIGTGAVNYAISEAATILAIGNSIIQNVTSIPGTTPNYGYERYFDQTAFVNNDFDFGARTILLESWLPIEIISVEITGTGPFATASFQKTRSFQVGGKDLFLAAQVQETLYAYIWGTYTKVSSPLSFRDLFSELDKVFCLGMQLQGLPGSYVLRIEPLSYFFSLASEIRLEGVMNVKRRFEPEKSFNSATLDSGANFGIASGMSGGNSGFTVTSGSANITGGATSGLEVNKYYFSGTTKEVFRIKTITNSTDFEVWEVAQISVATTTIFELTYAKNDIGPCLVNEPDTVYSQDTCVGDVLDLSNEFVTDIEKQGDQTADSVFPIQRNFSAGSDPKLFCFLQCDDGNNQTKLYKYMVRENSNVPKDRWAFNGNLTNAHKVMNNYPRLKRNFYSNTKKGTQFEGQLMTYTNDAAVKPEALYDFEHSLTFNQIQTIMENPAASIEVDFENNGTYEKAYIYEIRMKINTKKTTFTLYR